MIDPKYFGLIELGFFVLVVGGFFVWQFRSLAAAKREREAREAAERDRAGR